ncbi:hypothetical protein Taro_012940 [Colocasia esculenta]|uniref:Uncharacterized protein n=1 Tax=Colocasia esculenta TaxID=4460 RepID=A0A843UA76_COLES|nr:hypothetical protein [Colocasia esculenta]
MQNAGWGRRLRLAAISTSFGALAILHATTANWFVSNICVCVCAQFVNMGWVLGCRVYQLDLKDKSKQEEPSKRSKMICHECQGISRIRFECPVFLKKHNKVKAKKPKAMVATWSDSDESSSIVEVVQEKQDVVCGLMALEEETPEVYTDFVMVVSTRPLLRSQLTGLHGSVNTGSSSVDTRSSSQKTCLAVLDSVSTLPEVVSTLVTLPREPILPVWDSVLTHSEVVSTHSG